MTEDEKRDKYLQKKYGISLEWYNRTLQEQRGGCKICGSRPVTRSLPVDHDHKARYIRIHSYKHPIMGSWVVGAEYRGQNFGFNGFKTKSEGVQFMRKNLKIASVRGIICVGCNTGLRKFRDNPEFLEGAASYLRRHQQGQ
jgi:hypothetical protein